MALIKINNEGKIESILSILILICSGLFSTLILNSYLPTARAASEWMETSDFDFNNGTFENTTIDGLGKNAKIKINLSEIYHWTKYVPTNKPAPRYGHAMTQIFGTNYILLYGGTTSYSDTWIYNVQNNTWTNRLPVTNPGGMGEHGMAAIHGTDKVVLLSSDYYSETWVYDLSDNNWSNKNNTNIPLGKGSCAMATIYNDDKVMLFGGTSIADETWIYDLSDDEWTNMNPTTRPYYRHEHAMAPIWGTNKILMFGGRSPSYQIFNDTWIYDTSTNKWSKQTCANFPNKRYSHAMASIWGTDKVILLGGIEPGAGFDEKTWIYDYSDNNWSIFTLRNPDQKPSIKFKHAMSSVNGSDKVVLFGGYPISSIYPKETWVFKHVLHLINGTYVSKPFDTCSNSSFNKLSWKMFTPKNTTIKIQLRTADSQSNLNTTPFVGIDGSSSTFYDATPANIWSGHFGDRWVQYKVYFNISTITNSPELKNITIFYNCLPTTKSNSPENGTIINNNKPTFMWIFDDYDSIQQEAFHLLIDDNIEFSDINYDSGEQITSDQRWKFPLGTDYSTIQDGTWYWKVRSQDEDKAWSEFTKPRKIIIDTNLPSSTISWPSNNGLYHSLNSIKGNASEPANGTSITKIEIKISRLSDNSYWNGSSWTSVVTWVLADGTTNWNYSLSLIPLDTGHRYFVQSRATDMANNVQQPASGIYFNIDRSPPISKIEFPKNNIWLNELKSINGSCYDIDGAGVNEVEISIKCEGDDKYWDGKSWIPDEYWLTTTGANAWSYDTMSIAWENGDKYFIQSRAVDKIGNMELNFDKTSFMYDAQPPEQLSIYINNDDEFTNSQDVTLFLQAIDKSSGLNNMSFSINNGSWDNWEKFNYNKSFSLSESDGEKRIYFRVSDYSGNIAESVFDSIILDTTPPEMPHISINDNDKYTNSEYVTLSLTAYDSLSGLGEMSFSFNTIDWQAWEPFRNTRSISVTPGDGEIEIYFKVRDNVGNIAKIVSDSIILDTIPPRDLSFQINDGSTETNSTTVILNVAASDDTSGVDVMSFSTDGINWSFWEPFTNEEYFNFPPENGKKTIYFRVKDRAGNIAEPVKKSILLNVSKPKTENPISDKSDTSSGFENLYLFILIITIIFIIIVIIGLFIIKKRMKAYKQKSLLSGALTIKRELLPTTRIVTEQVPAVSTPLLPDTVTNLAEIRPQLGVSTKSTTVPKLAKFTGSTTEAIPSESTLNQAIQVPQPPLLPPAKLQDKETEVSPTIKTPVPTVVSPSPTPTIATVQSTSPGPVVHLPDSKPQPTLKTSTQPETQTKKTNQTTQEKD
jgi:hypothetical protein